MFVRWLSRIARKSAYRTSSRMRGVSASSFRTIHPCPRAERLRAALETMVAAGADPEGLLDTLMVEDGPALFLRGDIYGTRASTLVAISADGSVKMIERRYEKGGRPAGTTTLEFRVGS